MEEIIKIDDHAERAVADLLFQFKNKPRIQALVEALAFVIQWVEDLAFDLLIETYLDVAEGYQLDQWGKIVGERRRGLSDEDYRRFISARVLANLSAGTVDDIIEVFKIVTGGDVHYFPHYPAGFTLETTPDASLSPALKERIKELIQSITPAGVGVEQVEALQDVFRFSDPDNGFGSPFSSVI